MANQSWRAQSGIHLTLKVLQFVKRLRIRLGANRQLEYASIIGAQICATLETKKLRQLQWKSTPHDRKTILAANRVCKNHRRQKRRQCLTRRPIAIRNPTRNKSGEMLKQTLSSLDAQVCLQGLPLSAVANSDKVFLAQRTEVSFEGWSLNELAHLLVEVYEAINVLRQARSQYGDVWLIARGQEAGLNFDALFFANYEHLLMQLLSQLVSTLSRKALELLLRGGYDKKQHRLLSWFTEFSDKPRPLSTSLDLKPSLAVLWGVCWMFYDDPNRVDQANSGRVSRDTVLRNVNLQDWRAPEPTDYFSFGMELLGTQTQPQQQMRAPIQNPSHVSGLGPGGVDLRLRNTGALIPTGIEAGVGGGDRQGHLSRVGSRTLQGSTNGLGTYYSQFPATSSVDEPSFDSLLPNIQGNATDLAVYTVNNTYNSSAWQQFPQHSLPQRSARHLTTTTNIPTVRVTRSAEVEGYGAAPQPDFASAFDTNIYPSRQSPQVPALNIDTDFSHFVNQYNMGNVQPPQSAPVHGFHSVPRERTPSVNSNSNIPTPTSMGPCPSPLLSPLEDNRRFSVVSAGSQGHARQPSEESSSQDDDIGGKRNHTHKRAEEPPRNHDGKMVCKHKECSGHIFERKCEWSKHMDKHDRPYKCNVKGCEKLQGFTYSGGLLRHEREVHKMHGGTKKSLFCPFSDCKRSSGSGFTRKENLAEHIRRVHRRTSMSADLGHLIISQDLRQQETSVSQLSTEPSYQRMSDDDDSQITLKRKRSVINTSGDDTGSDLRSELKRLRRENEEKDERLMQLEAAVLALQQSR